MARSTSMTREEILANPGAASAALDEVKDTVKSPLPVADFPPDDLVTLPGGLVRGGKVIKNVTVRELNGEDEEALARAIQAPNAYHFLDVLLERGTVRIGDLSFDETQAALPDLLTGDRDEIILGIRAATYGDTVEAFKVYCPNCQGTIDRVSFSLKDDVERITLKDPLAEVEFDVSLRKGASARVRLATGAVQAAVWEMPDLLPPQRDDIMLSKCVDTWTRAGETQATVISLWPSMVRQMPAPDRRKILSELVKRQPGPRYNEVRFNHDGCGEEVTLALGITDLFRDLITGLV
jgi:hypothetical protein